MCQVCEQVNAGVITSLKESIANYLVIQIYLFKFIYLFIYLLS